MKNGNRGVAPLQLADDIVPIAEFKAHLSRVVRTLPARRRPVVITQNGKAAAVVMSPAEFDRLAYRARFVDAVEQGLTDVEEGRVMSDAELGLLLDRRLGPSPKARARSRRR
jgi:prevent-host-death family protein